MTTTELHDLEPIRSRDDFLVPFVEACKPPAAWHLGPEVEKGSAFEDTRMPIPYEGPRSILRVFEELCEKYGWEPEREHPDAPVIALVRRGASVTLEPGGQLELSGVQSENAHQVHDELREHMREIGPLSRAMGVRWLGVGFHPFARREDFTWVPKQRYRVMREYLPTRGGHALDMMLRTSTVQVNLDYESEADAMRKMRVALALAPATTAMFANSPWLEGRPHGGLTWRGRVWLDVDPDRTGLVPSLWKRTARFDDYVEWALDVPMFLFKRDGHGIANTGQTFRSFWQNGFQGHRPNMDDWKTHLNTLFPEVRLKKTIEIRGADAQSTEMKCSLPALWAGLLYDSVALDEAESYVADWTYAEVDALRSQVWKDGLRTTFRGRPLAEVAERIVSVAEGGLRRRARLDASGRDESVHLARLRRLVSEGRTPADLLLDGIERERDLGKAILERSSLRWE